MKRSTSHSIVPVVAGLLLLLGLACMHSPPVVAQVAKDPKSIEGFDNAMQELAAEVTKFLQRENITSITVGPFDGPAGASGGPAIVKGITDNLPPGISTALSPNAHKLSGTFEVSQSASSGLFCITIDASLRTPRNSPRQDFTRYMLTDEQSLIALTGGNGSLPVENGANETLDETRNESLIENIEKPSFAITVLPASANNPATAPSVVRIPNSPLGVEIMVLVGNEYVPLPVTDENGFPFVELQEGQDYAVRIINDSDQRIGAALFIDGINSLAFSNNVGFRKIGKWVVGPKNPQALIKGWHNAGRESFSFRITNYGDSVAGRAGIVGPAVGTISVQFFPDASNLPPSITPLATARPRGDIATGMGPPVDQNAQPVQMVFGLSNGQIGIRYAREHSLDLPADAPPTKLK